MLKQPAFCRFGKIREWTGEIKYAFMYDICHSYVSNVVSPLKLLQQLPFGKINIHLCTQLFCNLNSVSMLYRILMRRGRFGVKLRTNNLGFKAVLNKIKGIISPIMLAVDRSFSTSNSIIVNLYIYLSHC